MPQPMRRLILASLLELASNPSLGEPLQGFKGKYCLVVHPYRIVYKKSGDRISVLGI
ncbi:MAG: type II toxin-antitoxin system RelE/ParE family toxin [Candidatus Pacebacteria bacterium]|nr:type II toxin-antitoxin system RelE/ParE family toxin [Candidatus Paceibacterota bacterium]